MFFGDHAWETAKGADTDKTNSRGSHNQVVLQNAARKPGDSRLGLLFRSKHFLCGCRSDQNSGEDMPTAET